MLLLLVVVVVEAKLPISPSWSQAIGHAVSAGQKQEVIQPEPPTMIINIARLLVSCLHAWNLDSDLDEACKTTLGQLVGIVRVPARVCLSVCLSV